MASAGAGERAADRDPCSASLPGNGGWAALATADALSPATIIIGDRSLGSFARQFHERHGISVTYEDPMGTAAAGSARLVFDERLLNLSGLTNNASLDSLKYVSVAMRRSNSDSVKRKAVTLFG